MSRGDQRGAGVPHRQKRTWKRTPTGEAAPSAPAPTTETPISSVATPNALHTARELAPEDDGAESFQARLRYLFTTTRQATGAPWSFNAVARASGGHISVQAVYRLYTKAGANPSLETIRILAGVFGVDPDYFVRPGALREQQEWLEQAYAQLEADPHIAFVSRRMGRMSEADKALLVEFVRRLTDEPGTPTAQRPQVSVEEQGRLEYTVGLREMRQD